MEVILVVDEEPAFGPLAKIHLPALLWSGHFSGSADIRVDHLQLALPRKPASRRGKNILETGFLGILPRWRRAVRFVLNLLQCALVTGGVSELGQRSGLLRIFLFTEPALANSLLVDVQVVFEELRSHWLILFGFLLQRLELLPELDKAWFGPRLLWVLPT